MQVNAGPVAYASVFLEESAQRTFPGDKVYQLKQAFREFVEACQRALLLNGRLRADDQADYHDSLLAGYRDLVAALGLILAESFPVELEAAARHSQHLSVYTLLSGVAGSSSVRAARQGGGCSRPAGEDALMLSGSRPMVPPLISC